MARILCVVLLGLALASCGGSTVDRELATSETATEPADELGTPNQATPESAEEIPLDPAADPLADGEGLRHGDTVVHVGDRVRLSRRVGTITPPSGTGGNAVEAAAGKTGQITAIQDPSGLVSVTWDAQKWTLHSGYAWDGKETIDVADLEGLASRSGGDVELPSFVSTIHLGYLQVLQSAPDVAGNP